MEDLRRNLPPPDRAGCPPCVGPRALAARRAQRVTLRLAVPEELVGMQRFGNDYPELVSSQYWVRLQSKFEAFIESQVPEGSAGVRVLLDEEQTEVVLSFRPVSAAHVQ